MAHLPARGPTPAVAPSTGGSKELSQHEDSTAGRWHRGLGHRDTWGAFGHSGGSIGVGGRGAPPWTAALDETFALAIVAFVMGGWGAAGGGLAGGGCTCCCCSRWPRTSGGQGRRCQSRRSMLHSWWFLRCEEGRGTYGCGGRQVIRAHSPS